MTPRTIPASSGPRTEEGKRISSMNALKTGLTGRTVLLPGDDAVAYTALVEHLFEEWQPAGLSESNLVLSLADAEWRLRRVPVLEYALFSRGREEFQEKFAAQPDPERRAALTDLETMFVYEKQLRNLHLQEARLRRQREKDLAELKALQAERSAQAAEQAEVVQTEQFVFSNPPCEPANTGFSVFPHPVSLDSVTVSPIRDSLTL